MANQGRAEDNAIIAKNLLAGERTCRYCSHSRVNRERNGEEFLYCEFYEKSNEGVPHKVKTCEKWELSISYYNTKLKHG